MNCVCSVLAACCCGLTHHPADRTANITVVDPDHLVADSIFKCSNIQYSIHVVDLSSKKFLKVCHDNVFFEVKNQVKKKLGRAKIFRSR